MKRSISIWKGVYLIERVYFSSRKEYDEEGERLKKKGIKDMNRNCVNPNGADKNNLTDIADTCL